MSESTLSTLQQLSDAEFHALCDELIPRLIPRCFPVTPHGRNERGDSVKGQPDSYVGNSAKTCKIAIQYTVQEKSWWTKAIQDIQAARNACSQATEIILALPRDVDREGPKKIECVDWHLDAINAAVPSKLTVVNGRQICQELDTNSQDLRRIYLGIPCSRLNLQSLTSSCREANLGMLNRLESLKRYDSNRYISRDADHRLFSLWQDCLRRATLYPTSHEKRLLIPLVADSGLGKTSLLANFTQRSTTHLPVLLLLARDLLLDSDDSLVRAVIDRLQGSIDVGARSHEEVSIAKCFLGKTPLTVILDGLDETANPISLRRAISGWLSSRLGSASVLIVSSRIEFWRSCRDLEWQSSILSEVESHRIKKPLRVDETIASLDPMQGIELPGLFLDSELRAVWEKANRSPDEIWALPSLARDTLRHPFAAVTALSLLNDGANNCDLTSRTNILGMWLERRLELESDNNARISPELLRNALLVVAKEAQLSESSWVSVDQLTAAPRFDSNKPPGPVLEILIKCGLLETRHERSDQIRFAVEAIQDYFVAEITTNKIITNPILAADEFVNISFSKAVSQLESIGRRIVGKQYAIDFLLRLNSNDPAKAAIVLRQGLNLYSDEYRKCVSEGLGKLQASVFEADKALAVELLGRLKCDESKFVLQRHWTQERPDARMRPFVAHAAIAHGIVELVEEVFLTWWFKHDNFFVNLGPELNASPIEFKHALTQHARKFLNAVNHNVEYQRAVMVLVYLEDPVVIEAIENRTKESSPFYYESLGLLRFGTDESLRVYKKLVDRYLIEKGDAEIVNDEYHRWVAYFPFPQHIGRRPNQLLENYVVDLVGSTDKSRQQAGCSLAGILYTAQPFAEMVRQGLLKNGAYSNYQSMARVIGADRWLALWNVAKSIDMKKSLIAIVSELRDSRIEDVLIKVLQSDELRGRAATALGQMGSYRSAPTMRTMLSDPTFQDKNLIWAKNHMASALIQLRDEASLDAIIKFLKSDEADEFSIIQCVLGIATLGTSRAEQEVLEMDWVQDELRVRALVNYGSIKCIIAAIELAQQQGRGPKWLLDNARYSFMFDGRSYYNFRTDIEVSPLLDYVKNELADLDSYESLESLLDNLDGHAVREQYALWWKLNGTSADVKLKSPKNAMLSEVAERELIRRGDIRVLDVQINKMIEGCVKHNYHSFEIDRLSKFGKENYLPALRSYVRTEQNEMRAVAAIDVLGRTGDTSDITLLNEKRMFASSNNIVNAAYEAALRLGDPLRLAEYW